MKVGPSDLIPISGLWYYLSDKRYAGDNRLIILESPYRRDCLAPRCRLIISRDGKTSQGFGCSPIKMVRELGSERREAVRSLSTNSFGHFYGYISSTRGPELWGSLVHQLSYVGHCWVATSLLDNLWFVLRENLSIIYVPLLLYNITWLGSWFCLIY